MPSGPGVKTSPSNAGDVGSIPGQGAEIRHVSWPKIQNNNNNNNKKKNRSNIKTNSIKTLKRQKESGLYDKVGWGGDHGVRYRTMTSKYRTNKVGISLDTSLVTSKTLEQKQVLRFPEF